MRFGINIRVDAKAHRGHPVHLARNPIQCFQLRPRFHIKAEYAGIERRAHFISPLTYTGKYDFLRIAARFQYPLEFAARNDVETAAKPGEQIENGQIGVGFNRIANQVVAPGKRGIECLISGGQRRARVNIAGSADFLGNAIQRKRFTPQPAAAIIER